MNTSTSATWLEEAWQQGVHKTIRNAKRIQDTFPHISPQGVYDKNAPEWWTAGFWPGLLWLVYRDDPQHESAADLRHIAASCERQLEDCLRDPDLVDHDLGFIWLLSGVASYRQMGSEDGRRRGMLAANLLAARFHVRGEFIRAWNFGSSMMDTRGVAIIDSMMNLPLLYWASEQSGDPRFRWLAEAHADTVAREFVRADGSICHVVEFDPHTGQKLREHGGQGHAPGSAWARGTAWALHGFALSFRYTGEARYLETAERAADFFLAMLGEDIVPVWDFRAPAEHQAAWDSSAAAIAASGLLELAKLSPRGQIYAAAGERIVRGLYERYSPAESVAEEGLIMQGTVHYPEGRGINVPIIYGDYFYMEALAKLRGNEGLF
ncbi:unsaturated chondroitin disaccharide hydrolase [Paenibacillus polysaccharolyticus]|uniref:Unsaturated chondroitin disaccharide hydrolase n=1 Tax=Paenibacillus polysaccharolyticus TaxID=582692 RepID=A0A1G5H789_9BACL|nr:glycoside hydrolase family 88 protein [Paenibacillus polysaccharolyticus]SCY59772.1 unsaturated chondroitin disaccharide hydrolase [Paenibacillus polysaccharolyticus]